MLGYAVGNEIPAPIVRWHGRRRIESFLRRLYEAAKDEDPDGLVTYVNFPTTEYLQLPFLDFHCFNVYLESDRQLEAYLARLQNVAGDRPLVMAEIGLDSRRNGEDRQAEAVDWQMRLAFAAGCAGTFVFAWTDEWHRGGYDVEDWDFGLTDRRRHPKPALAAVRRAFREVPFSRIAEWPKVSVVVCAHNGARTLRWCLEGLRGLDYPDYEVIVVDDGSTDATAAIASECGYPAISTPNRGLSSARNTGLEAASGRSSPTSTATRAPTALAQLPVRRLSGHGSRRHRRPEPPPAGRLDRRLRRQRPRGPDPRAALGPRGRAHPRLQHGLPPRAAASRSAASTPASARPATTSTSAGASSERGETLGFSPAAVVWHRARDSVRAYWRQQIGYGRAEALLERKWPEKYNVGGHYSWGGRLYGNGVPQGLLRRWRVYYGRWGTGLFQAMYRAERPTLSSLALMPEWYLVIAARRAPASAPSGARCWRRCLSRLRRSALAQARAEPVLRRCLAAAATALIVQAVGEARAAGRRRRGAIAGRSFLLTTFLHMLQPFARLSGPAAERPHSLAGARASRPRVPAPRVVDGVEPELALARELGSPARGDAA